MSEPKFTKGPWTADVHHDVIKVMPEDDFVPIAKVGIRTNAHLIACAPEMYEMVEELAFSREYGCRICESYLDSEHNPDCVVGKLLAKCRGEK